MFDGPNPWGHRCPSQQSRKWTLNQMRVALPFLAVSSTPIKSSLSATSSYCKNVQSHETFEKQQNQHRTNMSNDGAGCSAGTIRLATHRMAALSNIWPPWQQSALGLTLSGNGSSSLQLKLCICLDESKIKSNLGAIFLLYRWFLCRISRWNHEGCVSEGAC